MELIFMGSVNPGSVNPEDIYSCVLGTFGSHLNLYTLAGHAFWGWKTHRCLQGSERGLLFPRRRGSLSLWAGLSQGRPCPPSRVAEVQGVSFGSQLCLSPCSSHGTCRTQATTPSSPRADPVWRPDGLILGRWHPCGLPAGGAGAAHGLALTSGLHDRGPACRRPRSEIGGCLRSPSSPSDPLPVPCPR